MGYYCTPTIFSKTPIRQEEIRKEFDDSHRVLLIHMRHLRSFFFEKRLGFGICYYLKRLRTNMVMSHNHFTEMQMYINNDMRRRFPNSYADGFAFGEERLTGFRQLQAFMDNFDKRLNWIDEMIKDLEQVKR